MKKQQLLIPVLVGLAVGQIFAEGDRPFTVVNTVRVGYSDNIDRNSNGEGSAFIRDMVDLSFRAALSGRTDLIFKSRFAYQSDKESNFYPNLYAVLTHSVSQRLSLELADKLRSDQKTSSLGSTSGRYNYYENTVSLTPDYILTTKDRVSVPVSYMTRVHDKEIESEDVNTVEAGVTWLRELSPQRTQAALNLRARRVTYPNAPPTSYGTVSSLLHRYDYDDSESGYDALELTAEMRHTFNPEWYGNIEAGVTHVQPDGLSYYDSTIYSPTNISTSYVKADNENRLEPFFRAGLAFEPSPRTRLTADITQRYQEANNTEYAGMNSRELRFGAQHDFTAKIMGKMTARFLKSDYDAKDGKTVNNPDETEERFDLDCRLQYKLNRINFLELGYKYREKKYDIDSDRDWNENMVDVGWRVEL